MKKFLPFIIIAIVVVVGITAFVIKGKSGSVTPTETPFVEELAPELPFDQRPFVSLTPRSDGHWLKLTISGINKVIGAASVDYVLQYEVPDHPSQGVPGTVQLNGVTTIDRDLLLGSESSGKFRYDEGVDHGQLMLKFRDSKKKLLGALTTDFHLQSKTDLLNSIDGKFTYKLSKPSTKGYFVIINTFGVIEGVKGEIENGPYGVFSSETLKQSGVVTLPGTSIMRYGENKWSTVKDGQSSDLGVFLSVK